MALSIKNAHTERLARMVAQEAGESITKAVDTALEERLERLKARRRARSLSLKERVSDILRRMDALPVLDTRSDDEILGYDEHGLPR